MTIDTHDNLPDIQKTSFRQRYLKINLLVIGVLFVLSLLSIGFSGLTENPLALLVAKRFDHNTELSLPTLYNYFLIIVNVGLLTLIYVESYQSGRRFAGFWLFLACVMFLLSYDEAASVHERLMDPMREIIPSSPFLAFPWTPIGLAFTIFFGFIMRPFLRGLDRRVAILMCVAGFIYVFGAICVETISGFVRHTYGHGGSFLIIATFEESCEMLGMVLFGCALIQQITQLKPAFRFTIA